MDHEQMRALMKSLEDAFVTRDKDGFLGKCETMMVLIQQHNMREEQVLYPMTDEVLADPGGLVGTMQDQLEDSGGLRT